MQLTFFSLKQSHIKSKNTNKNKKKKENVFQYYSPYISFLFVLRFCVYQKIFFLFLMRFLGIVFRNNNIFQSEHE